MFLELAGLDQLLLLMIVGIIGIVVLLVALVIYLMSAGGREDKERRRPMEETGEFTEEARPGLDGQSFEVMRILRDVRGKGIIVEVEGQKYERLADIKDGRVGRQVLHAAADLVRFTGVTGKKKLALASGEAGPTEGGMPKFIESPPPSLASRGEKKPALSPVGEKPELGADRPGTTRSPITSAPALGAESFDFAQDKSQGEASSEAEEFLRSLEQQGVPPSATASTSTPSLAMEMADKPSIGGFFKMALTKPPSESAMPARSFIDEIEDILQQLIAQDPAALGRDIHVRAGPNETLRIEIDGVCFDSADEVPDPVAWELIKTAVRRWEKS